MQRLSLTLARRRDERGAAAIIVSILLAFGVLTGMLALSVDVGNIMWERRQLQNGADSASMALARTCATQPTACNPGTTGTDLDTLLDGNANDRTGQLDSGRAGTSNGQCGRAAGGSMPACATATSYADLENCPPLPTWLTSNTTIPYVETYARTQSAAGTVLPRYFAQTLAGSPSASVSACARAAWGVPNSQTAQVPLTISQCEWDFITSHGATYPPAPTGAFPGYGGAGQPALPAASAELTLYLKTPSASTGIHQCYVNGKDTAGGFGYVDPATGCNAMVTSGNWANIDTGSSAPSGCSAKLASLHGKTIDIPIFDCLVKQGTAPTGGISASADCSGNAAGGAKSWYHIKGWAKFYLSGYKIGGSDEKRSTRSGAVPCSGGNRCLSGWFVRGTLEATSIVAPGGGTDFGVRAILLAG